MKEIKNLKLKLVIGLVVILGLFFQPIGHNSYGFREVVENPLTGSTWVQFDQGIYVKGFGSTTTSYPNVVTVVYADEDHHPKADVSSLNPSLEVRFSDAAKAQAEATVKWRLSNKEDEMLLTHQDNRNSAKLTETVLEKYTGECLNYAAQLMESETHYSGGKSKMAEDFQTQLEKGQYIIVTKSEYIKDSTSNTSRKITKTDVRRDANNIAIRKKSNIIQYGITIVSATIDDIDYIAQIDKKLKAKIEASTQESISKQLAITAEQEAITAARQGEKLIAETEAREQSAKREAVIRSEKATAVAVENKKQAILNADAELATKTAQAKGDKLKVLAGLSPREKAQFEKETAIGVAEALSKRPVPKIVMSGGSGKQSDLANSYTMENMLLLQKQLSK